MSVDPQVVQELFLRLIELQPAERLSALDRECAGDANASLRDRVVALLQAHEEKDSLLDQRSANLGKTIGSGPVERDSQATGEHTPQLANTNQADTTDYRRQFEPGLIIAGRYTLLQKIGEGGMGEVWVAKQTEPVKRKVALKLIKTGMDSKAVLQRFEQERQALAMMDHPNIARVLDGGMTPTGQPFFVMELVNGLPLNKFCDEMKLKPKERLELFVPICQAVQHAHQKGIVHRDLKPANILVTMIDAKPVPKVIDFGVAKATAGKLTDESMNTNFGSVIGTLEYMSPEQAGFSGEDIDTRADIYSLGVILYELLTGLRPIDARRLRKAAHTEMIRIIREEEPSKPSTRLSTDESLPSLAALRQTEPNKLMALLRGELDWVVMKCLEKQRERRYETANGLARDIQRYLADQVVEARPPSTGYQLKKFIRRHKGQVIAASLVILTLLAGVIGTTLGLIQANLARKEEAEQRRIAELNEATAREAEAKAILAGERAQASEESARLALYSADKILGIQERFGLRGAIDQYRPEHIATLQELGAQFEAVAKGAKGAVSAEAFNRLATVQNMLGKQSERDQSLERSVQLWTDLIRTDGANANEYRVQLAKTRAHQLAVLGQKTPQDPMQLPLTRQAAADWKAVTDADPTNATAFSERATVLNNLTVMVCPFVPYPQTPPPEQLAEKAALNRESLECMAKAVELRPNDQGLRLKQLMLYGSTNISPAAIRAALQAANQFPDQAIPRRFKPFHDRMYPFHWDRFTFDSELCTRVISASLEDATGERKPNPAGHPDELFRRLVSDPCREVLKEFPQYKYARGIEFLLVLREAEMAEWVPRRQNTPNEKLPTPTTAQRRRAAELYRLAFDLARKPQTILPVEFLTPTLYDKVDRIENHPPEKSTPITAEEYVWFSRFDIHDADDGANAAEGVLADLQRELAARKDWRPTPLFLHRILLATLPIESIQKPEMSKEKLISLWTQTDAMFANIRDTLVREGQDHRKLAENFSGVAVNVARRFHNWGDLDRAKAAYTRCIQLLEEWPALPFVDDSSYRAGCYLDRGNVYFSSRNWAEALADYQAAVAVSKKQPDDYPSPSFPSLKPNAHFRSGAALLRLNRFDEADKAFDECLAFRRAEKFETRPLKSGKQSIPWVVAVAEHDRAREYLSADRWDSALKWARQALKTLDENEEVYPVADVIRYRFVLHTFQADALEKLQQNEAAVREWDEAKKYATPAQSRQFAVLSAASYSRAGRHEEVATRLEEIAKSDKLTADEIYDLGCAFASCSISKPIDAKLAEKYCERAMAMLQRAASGGWNDLDHVKQDTDLDPLREREDFKKWLDNMKPKPAAIPGQPTRNDNDSAK